MTNECRNTTKRFEMSKIFKKDYEISKYEDFKITKYIKAKNHISMFYEFSYYKLKTVHILRTISNILIIKLRIFFQY